MTKWYDWLSAFCFAYFIYTNALIGTTLILTGNVFFGILCIVSAYLVNSWWDSWYIPFRLEQETRE